MSNKAKKEINNYLEDSLVNRIIASEVPETTKKSPCILGIDEAGRGPVLGPMVYSVAYYPEKNEESLNTMKFADSKTLTEINRERIFEAIHSDEHYRDLGYIAKIIAPNMISNCMLRRKKYNLNALSHQTAIELIRSVESKGIQVKHVYIDTVGPPVPYREKLQKIFPGRSFTVTEKADSKFAIVSAASICAKVIRDTIVQNWMYPEHDSLNLKLFDLGSGYPADPSTKKFLEQSLDPVFGFPTLARFSWSTISKILDNKGCKCDWNEPDDNTQDVKELSKQQSFLRNFVQKKKQPIKKVSPFAFPVVKDISQVKIDRTNADRFFEDRQLIRNQGILINK